MSMNLRGRRAARSPARSPREPSASARRGGRGARARVVAIAAAVAAAASFPIVGGADGEGKASADAPGGFLAREDVREWIRRTSEERGLDRHRVSGLFARLESREDILEKIAAPAERTLTWREYRPIFLGDERIESGRAFLAEHAAVFARAEERFGVPPHVVAAIIGVETFYGRYRGRDGVLESLATLAFDYPPRAGFFAGELAEFLVLSENEGWNALEIKGSYAGAMGMPQFISSSYRAYAVDFDEDGGIDLFDDIDDVVGSVANYLARHGWRRGEPVAARWTPSASAREAARALVRERLQPAVAPESVARLGFDGAAAAGDAPLSVMTFAGSGGEEFWVGYTNFYAITRYNHSRLYALAVHQLAEALRQGADDADG